MALKWITKVDSHPAAIITGSPVAVNGVIYVGVSSNEEGLATVPGYPCCTFRGSVVALDAKTGKILWQTFTVPSNGGVTKQFSGAAIWSPLAIDRARGVLYTATGDNYSVPEDVQQCAIGNLTKRETVSCARNDDYVDSVIALDLLTGQVKWATKMIDFDVWNVDCIQPPVAGATPCPSPAGPDLDFTGAGPNLMGNIVGVGQKSGTYWALNADTGKILWSTPVGPGSDLGGIMWGTASDGSSIYVPISNFGHLLYTLAPKGPAINWGSWAALDRLTGKILWQTADPTKGAIDVGGASVANGVVFAGSMSGKMYALSAQTGKVLWSFASGGSVLDAPSIVNGVVYWGSGYTNFHALTGGTGNNKVFAFSLGGN